MSTTDTDREDQLRPMPYSSRSKFISAVRIAATRLERVADDLANGAPFVVPPTVQVDGAKVDADNMCEVLSEVAVSLRRATSPSLIEQMRQELDRRRRAEALEAQAAALVAEAQALRRN